MTSAKSYLSGAVALATMLVAGSWTTGTAQAAPCDAPAEVTQIKFMADWLPNQPTQGPFWEAQLRGYYKDEGLDVDIATPANPADPIKLAARGLVQFSLSYVPEVMTARDTGIPVIAIATTARELVSGLMFTEDAGISSPKDLKGRTLGVITKVDALAYTRTILKAGGLTMKDVKVINPGFSQVLFIIEKKVDAAHSLTYYEGVQADLLLAKQGKPPVKFLMYTDYGVPQFYYQLVVTNEEWAKANPHTACRFLRASIRGVKQWMKNADVSLEYIYKKNDIYEPEHHRAMYAAAKNDWISKDGKIFWQDMNRWKLALNWAADEKVITEPAAPSTYFTNAYLPNN